MPQNVPQNVQNMPRPHAASITSSSSGDIYNTIQNTPPWTIAQFGILPLFLYLPSPTLLPLPLSLAIHLLSSSSARDHTLPYLPQQNDQAFLAALANFGCGSAFNTVPPGEPVASLMAQNVHRLPSLAQYDVAGESIFINIPPGNLERWTSTLRGLCAKNSNSRRQNHSWLAHRFSWAYLAEYKGLHELVDWPRVYAMAHRMAKSEFGFGARFFSGPAGDETGQNRANLGNSVSRLELQNSALAASFIALGSLSHGLSSAVADANAWLNLLFELAAACPNSDWQDGFFMLVHWALAMTCLVSTAQLDRLARETRGYFAAISLNGPFVRYLRMLEFQKLPKHEKECFSIVAKAWSYIKIAETVALILQGETPFQYEFPPIRETIQPDRDLVHLLFDIVPEKPLKAYCAYNVTLLALSLFFRRFEGCLTPKDITWAYLTLYSEFCAGVLPATLPLDPPITSTPGLLQQRVHPLGMALKASFLCVRWLLIIRAEPNKFVTLRFAHYVTTLMTMFNPFLAIVDTGVVLPLSLALMVLCSAQVITVLDMYNMLALQALFVAVMTNFASGPTSHWGLDLRYLIGVVAASYSRTRSVIENLQPFSSYPLSMALLNVSKVLFLEAAVMPGVLDLENPAKAFYAHLASKSNPADWNISVKSLFGMESTAQSYVEQLWRFGNVAKLHEEKPIHITKLLVLNTAFLRGFEHACRGFGFSREHVEQYLEL